MVTATRAGRRLLRSIEAFQPDCPTGGSARRAPARVSPDMTLAVTRLLATAVNELRRHGTMARIEAAHMPDYRRWPMLETAARPNAAPVRFYASPEAVRAAADARFPMGTHLVVETAHAGRKDVFAMRKLAALYRAECSREIWVGLCASIRSSDDERETGPWTHRAVASVSIRR